MKNRYAVNVRLSDREMQKLKSCEECMNMSKSNIIRAGLMVVMSEINQSKKEILALMDQGLDLTSAIITLRTTRMIK